MFAIAPPLSLFILVPTVCFDLTKVGVQTVIFPDSILLPGDAWRQNLGKELVGKQFGSLVVWERTGGRRISCE